LFHGGDQFRVQIMGVLMIVLWVGCLSLVILAPLRQVGMLRLSDDFQDDGADVREHSPRTAYKSGQGAGSKVDPMPVVPVAPVVKTDNGEVAPVVKTDNDELTI